MQLESSTFDKFKTAGVFKFTVDIQVLQANGSQAADPLAAIETAVIGKTDMKELKSYLEV